jgi:Cys-rich protein (TIGR01571 family)
MKDSPHTLHKSHTRSFLAVSQLLFASMSEQPTVVAELVKERVVEVIAPSDLAGGYEFLVCAGNNIAYKVRVPDGGVAAGERFYPVILSQSMGHNVPVGRWRDGLCDCCALGGCHAQCCLTVWCYPCALRQVLHRNKLSACANPTTNGQYPAWSAFKIFFGIVVMVYLLQVIIGMVDPTTTQTTVNPNTGRSEATTRGSGDLINWIISLVLALFFFVVTMRLRSYIRNRYSIPGSACGDCCCSFWCLHCTICQLARHTADYKNHPAACCSDTGLHAGAPDVV